MFIGMALTIGAALAGLSLAQVPDIEPCMPGIIGEPPHYRDLDQICQSPELIHGTYHRCGPAYPNALDKLIEFCAGRDEPEMQTDVPRNLVPEASVTPTGTTSLVSVVWVTETYEVTIVETGSITSTMTTNTMTGVPTANSTALPGSEPATFITTIASTQTPCSESTITVTVSASVCVTETLVSGSTIPYNLTTVATTPLASTGSSGNATGITGGFPFPSTTSNVTGHPLPTITSIGEAPSVQSGGPVAYAGALMGVGAVVMALL